MINQALIEAEGFDLISMGRPEGPGCYCFPNHVIRRFMDKLSDNYPYVVMDNEAGLEHLSRRTTQDTDLMLIVSDPSVRSLRDRWKGKGAGNRAGVKGSQDRPDCEQGSWRSIS